MPRAKKFDFTGYPYAHKLIPSSTFDYNPRAEPVRIPHTGTKARAAPQTGDEDSVLLQTENDSKAAPKRREMPSTQPDGFQSKPLGEAVGKLFAASKPPDEF